jgi:hypothetical protein
MLMTILYGWNTYLLKTISLEQLGIPAQQAGTSFEYRQKYFHLFFIPFFPLGRFWAVRQGGKLYHPNPELEQVLNGLRPGVKHGIWAWSGPLLGIACWLIISLSNNMEEKAHRNRMEKHNAMLVAFFGDKSKTAPLNGKLKTINTLLDSALSMNEYEDKKIDTSEKRLINLYLSTVLTRKDSLTGYTKTNTLVITDFYGKIDNREVLAKEFQTSLETASWKGYYSDTASVFPSLRKLQNYKYILLLKEYNRLAPEVVEKSYTSGYSLMNGALIEIETGAVKKTFKLMAGNSETVTQFSFAGGESSTERLKRTLDNDLDANVLKQAYQYVFGNDSLN